jgi:hypothetical protein
MTGLRSRGVLSSVFWSLPPLHIIHFRPFPNFSEMLLGDNVTDAIGRAAVAGVIFVFFKIVAVIERDFLPFFYRAPGKDPDAMAAVFRLAIGIATVVDQPGGIPGDIAIQIPFFIQIKNKGIIFSTTAAGIGFVDFFPDIFEDADAFSESFLGENSHPLDGGFLEIESFNREDFRGRCVFRSVVHMVVQNKSRCNSVRFNSVRFKSRARAGT